MGCAVCPASMCPLIAPDGSPWTGTTDSPCPEHDDIDTDGCPWWSMTCNSGGPHSQVAEAEGHGGWQFVIGPNKPKRLKANARSYDCPKADVCQWQRQSGERLCPPRSALEKGLDPRVVLF